MPRDPDQIPFNPHNLLSAVVGCCILSGLCSLTVYATAEHILCSIQSANVMALLITQEPGQTFVADDQALANNLNQAKSALLTCRDIALALAVGTLMVGMAILWRLFTKPTPNAKA
jgi:hypothetical protein